MPNTEFYKPQVFYGDETPKDLENFLNIAAAAVGCDPALEGAPRTKLELLGNSGTISAALVNAADGGKSNTEALTIACKEGAESMHLVCRFFDYKANGNKELLLKTKLPIYDVNNGGRDKSVFSLTNGPKSGQVTITVPVNKEDESYIALVSLTQEATVRGCFFGNASTKRSFVIEDLPVGTKVYIRWAAVTKDGVTEYSLPVPIMVT